MQIQGYLFVALALLGIIGAPEGQQAVVKDPAFEIMLPPGFPPATPTRTGDATGVDLSSQTRHGICRIQYFDFPDPVNADDLFASLKRNMRKGMRIDSDEEFSLGPHRGLRMVISATELDQVMRMDCVLVGRRLYRLWYIAGTTAETNRPEVRAFFDSFRLRP